MECFDMLYFHDLILFKKELNSLEIKHHINCKTERHLLKKLENH